MYYKCSIISKYCSIKNFTLLDLMSFVKFFNQWAHTAVGPVVLAKKYDLKIIPVFIRLNGNFTYHIEVQEPLPLEFTGDKGHDLIVNTQKCSDAYEQIISQYPEQWVWMHRRWKKQPDAEKAMSLN